MNVLCKRVDLLDCDPDNNRDHYLDLDPDNFALCKRGIRLIYILKDIDCGKPFLTKIKCFKFFNITKRTRCYESYNFDFK